MSQIERFIYLRVSKKDLVSGKTEQQVLEDQLPPILKKFNLKKEDCTILKEKGSAYKIDQIHNRKEFLKLIEVVFDSKETTIHDIFLHNYQPKDIEIYVFDSNRIMRNLEFGMFFSLLRFWFNINIYSVNQDNLNFKKDESLGSKMSKYMMSTVDSYLAEGYSKNVSDHTRKAVDKGDLTLSHKGKIWGKGLKDLNGAKLSKKQTQDIQHKIKELINWYKSKNIKYYYSLIINRILKDYNVKISKGYISRLKNGV